MARGFLSGILWGTVVSGAALVAASQFAETIDLKLPEPEAGAVELPPGSEFNRERPESQPVLPQSEGPTRLIVFNTSRDQATVRIRAAGRRRLPRLGRREAEAIVPGLPNEVHDRVSALEPGAVEPVRGAYRRLLM